MSSRTASSSSHAHPASEPRQRYDHIIDHQLTRTRRRLKLVDLGVMVMTLLGAVILYTLLLVLVDHWVIGLSGTARAVALGILLLGVGCYCARRLVPLAVRPINPCYAARAIEQSDASLKNSVINFLMCRRESTPTGRLIYRALQRRAALDLRQVNLDLAIDQSRLIRAGYLVVALMVILAAYTVLSPKDVFQTVKRVSAPWANLARPTRVTIDDVQPGHAEVIRGGQVEVSARVFGAGPDEVVKLLYTTEDRQTVDRGVPMKPPETGQYYTGTLPENSRGIQQSLKYRVEAGDASSSQYQLTMMHLPSIVVEKIEYRYPDYMDRPVRASRGEGEIRAVEGTLVTVHAKANHPIQQARIEFDPDDPSTTTTHKMNSEGTRGTYTFRLLWDETQNAPEHTAYRLAFDPKLSGDFERDTKNQPSAKHAILVTPDLPPEISILTPSRRNVDVPVNGRQRIEIRAIDPDYGLTKISLRAHVGGKERLSEVFPQEGDNGRTGQVVVEYPFRPAELNLHPGDSVTLWAEAEDNCSEPNIGKTGDTILNIVQPDPDSNGQDTEQDAEQDADQEKNADAKRSEAGSADQEPASDSPPSPGSESQSSQSDDNSSQNDDDQSAEEQSGQQQSDQGEKDDAEDSASESTNEGNKGGAQQESTGQPQPAQQGEETEGDQSGEGGQQESGASGGGGDGDQESGNQDGTGSAAGNSSGSEEGAGSPAGNSSEQQNAGASDSSPDPSGGSDNAGAEESDTAEDQSGSDGGASGQQQRKEQIKQPLHDGKAFEQLLEYLQEHGRGDPSNGESQAAEPSSTPRKPSPSDAADNLEGEERDSGAGGDSGGAEENQRPLKGSNEGQGRSKRTGPSESPSRSGDGQRSQDSPVSEDPLDKGGGDGDEKSDASDDGVGDARGNSDDSRHDQQSESAGKPESSASSNQKSLGDGQEDSSGTEPLANEQDGSGDDRTSLPDQTSAKDDPASSTGNDTPSLDQDASGSGAQQGGEREKGGKSESENESGAGDSEGRDSADQGESGSAKSVPSAASEENSGESPSSGEAAKEGRDPSPGGLDEGGEQGNQPGDHSETPPQRRMPSSDAQTPGTRDQKETGQRGREGTASGNSGGGGLPAESAAMPNHAQREIAEADEANTEYAREATDLVLEHLKDQQQDPDPELLDSLGWSPEELREFIARWDAMKRKAREQGGEARRELQDALRSLGLRPDQPQRRAVDVEDDTLRGMRDGGTPSQPPREVLEQFKAYKKGMARGRRD